MGVQIRVFRLVLWTVAVALLAMGGAGRASAASAEIAGKVVFVRGLMSAQHTDGTIDVLGAGDRLWVGDVLITASAGFGTIELQDGSRITLRPGTRFSLEDVVVAPEKPSLRVRLLQGGLRVLSGWIAKRRSGEGFQVLTETAVAGVRGTEFDARLCEGDCGAEKAQEQGAARPETASTLARVVQVQGHLAALEPDGRLRVLSAGAAVLGGDRLETGPGGFAVIAFRDGSRITLQSNSAFSVDDYDFRQDEPEATPSAFFRLIRGGVRMLTGAIAKRRPERVRVATPTAVAGVRGTGFDLTLCKAPCEKAQDPENPVAGRVLMVEGPMSAQGPATPRRELQKGDDIFQGDLLQTGSHTVAVVVFRDASRVALQPGTRFEVSRYHYAGQAEDGGLFRLYRGGVRVLAGWLAKSTAKFGIQTATATIGVRGTGFDLLCTGACASDDRMPPPADGGLVLEDLGLVARVWQGTIAVTNASGETLVGDGRIVQVTSFQNAPVFLDRAPAILDRLPAPRPDQLVFDLKGLFSAASRGEMPPTLIASTWDGEVILRTESGRSVSVLPGQTFLYAGGASDPLPLTGPPAFIRDSPAPRPDQVPVDLNQLFAAADRSGAEPGLYISVYDGDVVLSNAYGRIDLGRGESGFASFTPASPVRLAAQPLFFLTDPYPRPGAVTGPEAADLFNQAFGGTDIRKETECEIR